MIQAPSKAVKRKAPLAPCFDSAQIKQAKAHDGSVFVIQEKKSPPPRPEHLPDPGKVQHLFASNKIAASQVEHHFSERLYPNLSDALSTMSNSQDSSNMVERPKKIATKRKAPKIPAPLPPSELKLEKEEQDDLLTNQGKKQDSLPSYEEAMSDTIRQPNAPDNTNLPAVTLESMHHTLNYIKTLIKSPDLEVVLNLTEKFQDIRGLFATLSSLCNGHAAQLSQDSFFYSSCATEFRDEEPNSLLGHNSDFAVHCVC